MGFLGNWKFVFLLGIPLLLIPLLFVKEGYGSECRCGFVLLLMGVYFVTEVIPFPVTAFLPIVLFPLLGVQDTASVSRNYMKEQNMMLVGGLIIALAVEYSNLHRRVALRIISSMGTSPSRLMLGTMLTTTMLSMWIPNSAAVAIMIPIVFAIINELQTETGTEDHEKSYEGKKNSVVEIKLENEMEKTVEETEVDKGSEKLRTGLLIGIMAAANIGGLFWPYTAHSSVPLNLLYSNVSHSRQITNHTDATVVEGGRQLTIINWMIFNLPPLIVNILIAWLYLVFIFVGKSSSADIKNRNIICMEKYKGQKPISFHQISICLIIILLALLCVFRDPKVIGGWENVLVGSKIHIGDSTAAMLIVFLIFLIPRDFSFLIKGKGKVESLLDWKFVQNNLPWGVVLLMGGGFAAADACQVSGLSLWLGEQLTGLKDLPQPLTLLIVMILSCFLAEFITNTASANLLIPIILSLSNRLGVDKLYMTLPVTLVSSTAFILPVATIPNAIVFASGKLRMVDMIKAGAFLNIACIIVLFLFNISYGKLIFSFHNQDYYSQGHVTL